MAVIQLQGKQYIIQEGQEFIVPHLKLREGEKIKVKDLLNNKELSLIVIKHQRGPKIRVLKYRRKTRYKRNIGYKDWQTVVKAVKADDESDMKQIKQIKKPIAKTSKTIKKKVKNA